MALPQNNYINILNSLKDKIRQARYKAATAVNVELLKLYWEIGNSILEQQKEEGWGSKVTTRLAKDLKLEFPDFKGLSERNLVYMQTFANAYPNFLYTQVTLAELPENKSEIITQGRLAEIQNEVNQPSELVQGVLAQLSWYHHITLLDKVKAEETRMFYIHKTIENGWSRDIMVHQIESKLHLRIGTAITNFKETLAVVQSELAQQTFKNPYILDFFGIRENFNSNHIKN